MEKEKLITEHIPFAKSIAGKYTGCGIGRDDLQGIAYVGLCIAADKFQEEKGYCFSTFAGTVIHNEIRMNLRKQKKVRMEISLYTPVAEGINIVDLIPDPADCFAHIACLEAEKMTAGQLIEKCLLLDQRERMCLFYTYIGEKTQEEIADVTGLSQSYVSRVLKGAKAKLRDWHLKNSA